ncbi:Major Facilitator Superfamily protein [bacterium YEK0313]|nr:Major Facilitator Superfamily protein [bacterium YEK0313]
MTSMTAPAQETQMLPRILVYLGSFSIATAYGLFLILPLHVKALGGNEEVVGRILFAGAFGTLLSVGLTTRLVTIWKPYLVLAAGALCYAAGSGLFAFSSTLSALDLVGGFLLGVGWALAFTISPIMLSNLVTDANRAVLFSVLSAFNALGLGIAPLTAQRLIAAGVPHSRIFLIAVILSVLSAALFYAAGRSLARIVVPRQEAAAEGELAALLHILRSPAIYPLIMVFLGACVLSSMFNFQTTYALVQGLDYSIFYGFYTAAVIAGRFLVSGMVSRREPMTMTIVLLTLMVLSMLSFAVTGANVPLYAASAALFGLSYGLVYPLIQAQAVNASPEALRPRTLVYFSMAYFIGFFGFPLIGGRIIVTSGYQVLLVALLVLAGLELAVAVWRSVAARSRPAEAPAPGKAD